MAFFDGLGSALAGGFLSLVGGERRNAAQAEQAQAANAFSAQQFATRYQTTVKDMAAAGLNPMLAYSQGGGSPPSGQQAQMTDTLSPAVESFNRVRSTAAQNAVQDAQVRTYDAQARKTNAEAAVIEQYGINQAEANLNQTLANTGLSAAQIAKVNSETENNIATLKNIPLEGERLRRMAEMLFNQSNLMFQQQLTETQRYDLLKAQASLYIAQTGLAKADTQLKDLDIDAALKVENFGRQYKQIEPIIELIKFLIKARTGR